MKIIVFFVFLVALVGCTPIQKNLLPVTTVNNRSEVVIYREAKFTLSGVGMIFGSDGNDYVKLPNGRYTSVYMKPGNYEFFVRSDQADTPFIFPINLKANEITCLRAFVNDSAAAVAILGGTIGYLASRGSSSFKLEKTKCLSPEEIGDRKIVTVEYAG